MPTRMRRSSSDDGKTTQRVVLRFHPKIAPVQVGVFPLARNKTDLVDHAQSLEKRAAPEVPHPIRRRQCRPALSPPRRNRHPVLHHGRLPSARRPRGHGPQPRLDEARPRLRRPARSLPQRTSQQHITARTKLAEARTNKPRRAGGAAKRQANVLLLFVAASLSGEPTLVVRGRKQFRGARMARAKFLAVGISHDVKSRTSPHHQRRLPAPQLASQFTVGLIAQIRRDEVDNIAGTANEAAFSGRDLVHGFAPLRIGSSPFALEAGAADKPRAEWLLPFGQRSNA